LGSGVSNGRQFGRRANLVVAGIGGEGLDLSEMHFRFRVLADDQERPNTAEIRIYNLSTDTLKRITGKSPVEYSRVVLQAGYEDGGSFGVIFDGTIKQFRYGRESSTDTYLDILAADGDMEYNFGVCNMTLAAGSTKAERVQAIAGQMGLSAAAVPNTLDSTGGTLPRGKVLWGMARQHMRCAAAGATWSIQNGKVQVVPLDGYLPGEAVVLNAQTGLIGFPEQTEQGVKARCLLNPRLRVAGLVQINNTDINRTAGAAGNDFSPGQLPYDRRAGPPMLFADVTADGFYRLYVVEYVGDTRGQDWYSDIICLAVDKTSDKVKLYG
jgi:hypothetical protein